MAQPAALFNPSSKFHESIFHDLNKTGHVYQRGLKPHLGQLTQRLICHKQLCRMVNTSELGGR